MPNTRETTRAYGIGGGGARWAPVERQRTEELGVRPAPCGPLRLVVETRGERPRQVALAPGAEVAVGSSGAADVRVDDPTVSALHCRVAHAGAVVDVIDLGSTNGVRVGGVRVTRAALPVGGQCEIGKTILRVMMRDAVRGDRASPLSGLVGSSAPMRALAAGVRRVAPLRLPALLRGESGTGKDLVARAMHDEGPRAEGPFVALNAAAITRELAETELFGHQRGAFTGAVRDRRGAFREADGGTLFLDEIGAVPLEVQAKLLRVVEEGVVRPVGGEAAIPVDVRLVAATCEPLEKMVETRRFRQDLYERLAVCVVVVPPLRDRLEDVPALARYLLATSDVGGPSISDDAIAALRAQRWLGNVRELRNVLVQAAVLAPGPIQASHVAAVLAERDPRGGRVEAVDVLCVFEESGRNVSETARRVGVARSTMRDMLRAAGVPAWPRRGAPSAPGA